MLKVVSSNEQIFFAKQWEVNLNSDNCNNKKRMSLKQTNLIAKNFQQRKTKAVHVKGATSGPA